MITFVKLFNLMETRGVLPYHLRRDKIVGAATAEKLRLNQGNIDTRTISALCEYLECQPGDIMAYQKEA